MFFSYGFAEIVDVIAKTVESAMSKTPEDIAEIFEVLGLTPVGIVREINESIREARKDDPAFDPTDPREELEGIVSYLEKNGFIYDENNRGFRER